MTVYIDGVYEHRYRKDSAGMVQAEQNIIHVMDGRSRIATMRIGDRFHGTAQSNPSVKYNLENHLGTSTTRLTSDGDLFDREEFYPFGDSSLRTFERKRYRYVGKEKDAESGLYYYGARYYSAWSCRFISIDPLASDYPMLNAYNYASNSPIGQLDIDGLQNPDQQTAPSGGESSGGTSSRDTGGGGALVKTVIHGVEFTSTEAAMNDYAIGAVVSNNGGRVQYEGNGVWKDISGYYQGQIRGRDLSISCESLEKSTR